MFIYALIRMRLVHGDFNANAWVLSLAQTLNEPHAQGRLMTAVVPWAVVCWVDFRTEHLEVINLCSIPKKGGTLGLETKKNLRLNLSAKR